RFAMPLGTAPLATGFWSWSLTVSVVVLNYGGTKVADPTPYYGATTVVNRNASALGPSSNRFGQGWRIPGLDQIVRTPDQAQYGYSWIRSDGTAAWQQRNSTTVVNAAP